jgi:hypothetical protein
VAEVEMPNHDPERVDHIIQQGRALVRAIEAFGTIEPSGLFERLIAGLMLAAYKRRLRGIVEVAPAWMTERILSASERIDDKRMALWMCDNWQNTVNQKQKVGHRYDFSEKQS